MAIDRLAIGVTECWFVSWFFLISHSTKLGKLPYLIDLYFNTKLSK
jgi:hypothetical protein